MLPGLMRFWLGFLVTAICIAVAGAVFLSGAGRADEGGAEPAKTFRPAVYTIAPGPAVRHELQGRLIEAVPGDVILLEAGRYELDGALSLTTDNVTIRGRGTGRTVLSFKHQQTGSHGLLATGDNVVLEGFAIEDTAGTALKILDARNVTLRDVRAEWTGGETPTNGAYGLYPVQCDNVLIEDCVAIGAADAGIYVGQSRTVVVRRCRAERNVAGIEIENTIGADVYENVATDNAGGILVFDLPGLQQRNGRRIRVYRNRIVDNNHENFAPKGNLVASIPAGTGLMIMATDEVEVFENEIARNQTCNLSILSYLSGGTRHNDQKFDPYPEGISIHDNRFAGGGEKPGGELIAQLLPLLGESLPDLLYDGATDAQKYKGGVLPAELGVSIRGNGAASFANFNYALLTPANLATGRYRIDRDLKPYARALEPLPPVELRAHSPPQPSGSRAVAVYRSVPRRLSGWKLFRGSGATQQPVEGVLPYDLNTPLFSDYTTKHRFIRLPEGAAIEWRETDVLEFPVGTALVKTFAAPRGFADAEPTERLLETRIEVREPSGWYGFSYLWNDEQTDAVLRLGGASLDLGWADDDGGARRSRYQVPNANECLSCHRRDKEFVPLGPTARNLNRVVATPEGRENQFTYWKRTGVLRNAPESAAVARLAVFDDPQTGSAAERARAYLEVNCAHCHNPLGTAHTSGLDLRSDQREAFRYGVWKPPVAAGQGSGGRTYDLVPGRPEDSILLYRMQSLDASVTMPPLAHGRVHEEAVGLIREWIAAMADSKPPGGGSGP